jgi:2-hydroxy-6-oxonona-2,4-dienedioate hydrolase
MWPVRTIGILAVLSAAAVTASRRTYRRDLAAARRRIDGRSDVFTSTHGTFEYARVGSGEPLLMIHGSGGGFDQALAAAKPMVDAGYEVIAPSRFGYLRSDQPPDPSPAQQADAFAELLDHIGIERIPVCGGSAGALSAIQFALRHPARCSALVLIVPAAWAPGRAPAPWTPLMERAVTALLGSDFLYWAILRSAPSILVGSILATDPALLARADAVEQRRITDILENILPVSARRHGLLNDSRFAGNPVPVAVEQITAGTLIVSVEDDRYGTAAAARDLASRIPGAELVVYPSGGHVWIGRDAALWRAVRTFLERTAAA